MQGLVPFHLALLYVVTCVVCLVGFGGFAWWVSRRDRRREELRRQLFEMEQAIREEGLPDDVREELVRQRERQAEIRREARRRLGLPEEEPPNRRMWG
jgi:hypothetical protein